MHFNAAIRQQLSRGLHHCAVRTLQSVDPVKQRLKRAGRGESDLWGPNLLDSAPRAAQCSMGENPGGPRGSLDWLSPDFLRAAVATLWYAGLWWWRIQVPVSCYLTRVVADVMSNKL